MSKMLGRRTIRPFLVTATISAAWANLGAGAGAVAGAAVAAGEAASAGAGIGAAAAVGGREVQAGVHLVLHCQG